MADNINDSTLTRTDITLIGVPANTPVEYRPYWNSTAFEMRDPKNPDAPPPLPEGSSVSMVKAGRYTIKVPDNIELAEVSLCGGAGGGGASGYYKADKVYNGSSGGGGGSSALIVPDSNSTPDKIVAKELLAEAGGAAGGNGAWHRKLQNGGRGGRGAVTGRSLVKVTPGQTLIAIVGGGGRGAAFWNLDALGQNGGTNKGGEGGSGFTAGKKGDDGTITNFTRASGDGGGENAGKSAGQALEAYDGADGRMVGDIRSLFPTDGGVGGLANTMAPEGSGKNGADGWIKITWMEMPKTGLAFYAKWTAQNGSQMEVAFDTRLNVFRYKLTGMSSFKIKEVGKDTEYSQIVYGSEWRPEGTKIKIKSIEHIPADQYVAIATPSQISDDPAITVKKSDGIRVVVIGWDAFYQDRFEWTIDFPNSDFTIIKV